MRLSDALAVTLGYALVAGGLFVALRYYEPVRVDGSSMEPALTAGDVVLVRRGMKPQVGDIALLRGVGGGGVLHRVVRVERDGSLTTQGDANAEPDACASSPEEVAGRVTSVVPVGGALKRWRRR